MQFWDTRLEIEQIIDNDPYIMAFPPASGYISNGSLNCVLLDHIMLEYEEKTNIKNYSTLETILRSSGIKTEKPSDRIKWIRFAFVSSKTGYNTSLKGGN